jgi:hypothetical protein
MILFTDSFGSLPSAFRFMDFTLNSHFLVEDVVSHSDISTILNPNSRGHRTHQFSIICFSCVSERIIIEGAFVILWSPNFYGTCLVIASHGLLYVGMQIKFLAREFKKQRIVLTPCARRYSHNPENLERTYRTLFLQFPLIALLSIWIMDIFPADLQLKYTPVSRITEEKVTRKYCSIFSPHTPLNAEHGLASSSYTAQPVFCHGSRANSPHYSPLPPW